MSHSDAEIREQLNKILKSSSSTDMYSTEYSAEDYVKMFDSLLALIEEQTRLARINELYHIKWYMEDAISMHKTPTRVVARLGSAIDHTEKRIAQLSNTKEDI